MRILTELLDRGIEEGASRIHIHPADKVHPLQFRLAGNLNHERAHEDYRDVFEELDLTGRSEFEGNILYRGRTIRYFQSITTTGPDLVLILEHFPHSIDFATRPDITIPSAS